MAQRTVFFMKNIIATLSITVAFAFSVSVMAQEPAPEDSPPSSLFLHPPPLPGNDFPAEARSAAEKNPLQAIQLYQKAVALRPTDWQLKREFAQLAEKSDLFDLAVGQYEAVRNGTKTPESYTDVARALRRGGRLMPAAMEAEAGLKIFADHAPLLLEAGMALAAIGQGKQAIAYLDKLPKDALSDPEVSLALGKAYTTTDNPVKAAAFLETARGSEKTAKEAATELDALSRQGLRQGNAFLFPPSGWMVGNGVISDPATGRLVTLAIGETGTTIEGIAAELATGKLPKERLDTLEGKFSGEILAAAAAHQKDTHGLTMNAEEISASVKQTRPPVLTLNGAPLDGIPDTYFLEMRVSEPVPDIPGSPFVRSILSRQLKNTLVALVIDQAAAIKADEGRQLLTQLAARLALIPAVEVLP